MEENKKIVVNLQDGATKTEVILREGAAPKVLDPKAPVKIDLSGVIGTPVEFLSKRISQQDQIDPKRCHVKVDREQLTIELITAEDDDYLRGRIIGKLSLHPKFKEFGINQEKVWEPMELGQFFKMNRAFFPNMKENMKLVSDLKNFKATVNSKMERSSKENGSMQASYGQVVNSNLPDAFTLNISIFKGVDKVTLQVETYATIDGSTVYLQLFSPSANELIEELRDRVMDEQIEAIMALSSDIAIIEQ